MLAQSMNYRKRDAISEVLAVVIFPTVLVLCGISAWHIAATRPRRSAKQMGDLV
jgi:sensor domain CHASE-containing protein